jgi:hypothetical protein
MKVKRVFRGVPKGQIYPVTYHPGDEVPAELVAAAVASGADQDPPEGSSPAAIRPQAVSQMAPNGTVGRSGGSKGKGKPAPAAVPVPAAGAKAGEGEGDSGEGVQAADTGAAGDLLTGSEGADGEGAQAAAADAAGAGEASGEPNLGGLG